MELELLRQINNQVLSESEAQYLNALQAHLGSSKNPMWKYVDAKTFIIVDGNESAHVSIMTDSRLKRRTFLGFFGATSLEVGKRVIQKAEKHLPKDSKEVYAPIDGLIIANYRFSKESDLDIPGEPVNPEFYIDCFRDTGYKDFNNYVSAKASIRISKLQLKLLPSPKGFEDLSTRTINSRTLSQDHKILYDLTSEIFPPLSEYCSAFSFEEYDYIFQNSKQLLASGHTHILYDAEKPIGAIFSYVHQDSLIIKTIGVLKEYQGTHASKKLIELAIKSADEAGCKTVKYALVRDGNKITKMKRGGVKIYRKYLTLRKQVKDSK